MKQTNQITAGFIFKPTHNEVHWKTRGNYSRDETKARKFKSVDDAKKAVMDDLRACDFGRDDGFSFTAVVFINNELYAMIA